MNELAAIIVAAGKSQRMGGVDKQMRTIAGVPVLARTVAAFEACEDVGAVVLVINPDNMAAVTVMGQEYSWSKVRAIVAGGERRQDSVGAGLLAVTGMALHNEKYDWIAVHDGARPLVTPALISAGLEAAREVGAAIAAIPATETVKVVDATGVITSTPERSNLWLAQTPQIFRTDLLEAAYKTLEEGDQPTEATDDARLLEMMGRPVKVYEGERTNIKITTALDLLIAEAILRDRGAWVDVQSMEKESPTPNPQPLIPEYRTGFGYDAHRLVEGRSLILGGVEVPFHKGLDGHSDADVLLHTLIDAILGAAGMGDIGAHFPSSDPSLRGISSLDMLSRVMERVTNEGWRVVNVDGTIVAQQPRLSPHTPRMRSVIAEALGIEESRVNVKSKTTDGMGFTGTGEGMVAYCVVQVMRTENK